MHIGTALPVWVRWLLSCAFVGGIFLTAVYVCRYTPLPVYLLDHLNLRHFVLPDILCRNCSWIADRRVLVGNSSVCTSAQGEGVFLITVVISYHANLLSRNAIRQTWGNVRQYKGRNMRLLFAFGTHADANLNNQLVYEQDTYGDILQLDIVDQYHSLTNKTVLTLRWIEQHCPRNTIEFILKTDDDSFNNIPRIVDFLSHSPPGRAFIGGYCFTIMPDRSPASKYYVAEDLYPDAYYPTYCAGPGYIVSRPALSRVLAVAANVNFLPMEDVYIAGMCRVAAGIAYVNIPGMIVGDKQLQPCDMATWAKNTHNVYPERMRDLWRRAEHADPAKHCVFRRTVHISILILLLMCWIRLLFYIFNR